MPYTIPDNLDAEIDALEAIIQKFQAGDLDPTALKAQRVPFGIYEQRTPETYMVRLRCIGGTLTRRLKGFRRVFTRYDKLDLMFTAFVGRDYATSSCF